MTTPLAKAIAAFSPALPLAVAFSGGADSTALLLACAEKWPGQVHAVHIHHGIQAAADDFEQHCRTFCKQLNVSLVVKKVDGRHAPGQSPEDAARRARYKAFEAVALDDYAQLAIKNIAIAQHADDQVETLLLALSRGSGLPGLSAMPASWVREGITYHRPLLAVRASDIRTWLAARGVAFIEDPSNVDEQFTRNRIRARLLPALEATFPQFRDTFARSAAHAAQAQAVLLDVAVQDLALMGTPPLIVKLQHLSRPRQANVLRHWLNTTHHAVPSAAQLAELLDQIAACTTRGHQIRIKVGTGFCERRGAALHWYNLLDLL
ncbi:MAG: tRNA lysidine(34) synthetase TilS [Rhodoferax sp.]|uniref:tRNA lysidine(34) synthetase TilS n=1 Tax=Rhodoferax sp. TaxID=50421 RepID=UPI00182606B9|nr:tRNA lysidine(34) synthetase TilS [Rhodoferax sp.]NMM15252.1 tRNA lysidine(34) synthetase TilS [Rhodoferax sp.]NMM19737.1 tRNA lysidine(34) synthetase TilS [Rhodoferax sp.]